MSTLLNPPAADESAPPPREKNRRPLALALLIIAILYLLLQNPYWVRYGDSEVYLSLARSLLRGQGYRYNGQPVAIVTPAWPFILAAAMKISTSLGFLKLLPMLAMLGFFAVAGAILNYYTTPRVTAICLITAAILQPVCYLSYMFFSDALFSLVGLIGVWMALQISRGRDSWPWIVLLMLTCAATMLVRWAALPWFVVIGAAVLEGEFWPRPNRRWIAFALAAMTILISFVALRKALHVDPARIDPRYDALIAGQYDLVNQEYSTYTMRFTNFGQWIGGILWKVGQTYRVLRSGDNAMGWILSLLILFFVLIPAVRRRQWMWIGAAAYVVALGINWPNAVVRYIVPLTPFIVYAAYTSTAQFMQKLPASWNWPKRHGVKLLMASILLINGGIYLADVIVMRCGNFYNHIEGGAQRQLIDAGAFLLHQPNHNGEIAISQSITNFGRQVFSGGYFRALN
ncbi:MAG TPA: hypothetical protein VGF52_01590, partial [Tepidisphaeraceae bacterium]